MTKWNFMLIWVEHEKKFYNLGAWSIIPEWGDPKLDKTEETHEQCTEHDGIRLVSQHMNNAPNTMEQD